MSTTNPDPPADRPAPHGSSSPASEKPRGDHGGRRWFHGLGMTYLTGLALLVLGGSLGSVPIVGVGGILPLIYGATLIARAVEGLEGAPVGPLRSLAGGVLLIVGLLGAIQLAYVCSAIVGERAGGKPPVLRGEVLWIASACAVWPGVVCVGAWLRRRQDGATLRFLWLSIAATYPMIYAASLALSAYLLGRL